VTISTLLHFPKLTARQQRAIPALLTHPPTRAAAAQAGIHEMTLIKWMRQPDFDAAYREARYVVMEEAFAVLQKACTQAAQTMMDLMKDTTLPAFVLEGGTGGPGHGPQESHRRRTGGPHCGARDGGCCWGRARHGVSGEASSWQMLRSGQ
jgi:hypothetical protein